MKSDVRGHLKLLSLTLPNTGRNLVVLCTQSHLILIYSNVFKDFSIIYNLNIFLMFSFFCLQNRIHF